MIKKLGAALAGLVLAVTVGAVPAQAVTYYGCGPQSICLYQAKNHAQERWSSSLNNVYQHFGSCLNLSPAKWANGTPIADNTASLVVNNEEATSPWIYYDVYVYNWANCQNGGGYRPFAGTQFFGDLSQIKYVYGSQLSPYHTITSIGIYPKTD